MADTPGSIVLIEEITGGMRSLELRGPCLPKRGASYEGEHRLITTWYPGNPFEATQQVMGDSLAPSEWEGIWTTTRMVGTPSLWTPTQGGAPQSVTRASTMRDIVEDIAGAGALLRVTWATGDGRRVLRLGRIGAYKFPHDRMDDIGWRLTFVWTSRGTGQARVLSVRNEDVDASLRDLAGTLNDLQGQLQAAAIVASNPRLPGSASDFTLGDLESLAKAPQEFTASLLRTTTSFSNRVGQLGQLVEDVVQTPDELRGQVLDTVHAIGGTMQRTQVELGRTAPERLTTRPGHASSLAEAVIYFGRVNALAGRVAGSSGNVEVVVRSRQVASSSRTDRNNRAGVQDAVKTYRSKAGDTFASISIKFYGLPDGAATIARANHFPGYQVAPGPGAVLLIPIRLGVSSTARTKEPGGTSSTANSDA